MLANFQRVIEEEMGFLEGFPVDEIRVAFDNPRTTKIAGRKTMQLICDANNELSSQAEDWEPDLANRATRFARLLILALRDRCK